MANKLLNLQQLYLLSRYQPFSSKNYHNLSYRHNIGTEPLRALTTSQLAEEASEKYGDRYAVISRHQGKKVKFSEALDQADRLAGGLLKIGLVPGDCVGIWATNSAEWYITNMACARAGLVLACLNPAYQSQEIEYCINTVGIKALICDHTFKTQNYYELLKAVCKELPESVPGKLKSENLNTLKSVIILSDEHIKGTFKYNDVMNLGNKELVAKVQNQIIADNPSLIHFTSGTTGKPKAAVVSNFSVVNNSYFIGKRNELSVKHQTICVQVPLFHAYGTVISISGALNHGATLVIPAPNYNPDRSLDALKEEKCTVIYGTPTMYVDLIRVQRERKEQITPEIALSAGASCSPHLFKSMLEVLNLKKVKSLYGLSEATAAVFQSLPDDSVSEVITTVGYLQEHTEAKVIDENGQVVPLGTPGELCVRGYFNMLGYWNDKEKTEEVIGPTRWLRTGDQFVMDENGYGRIVGRLKEMIIRGGENIYPKEIEDYLNTHPNILDSQVIGLPHERLGEEVCACIRVRKGKEVTDEDIKQFCKGKIAHFKIPSVIKVVDSFPTTASGKIQKFKLIQEVMS